MKWAEARLRLLANPEVQDAHAETAPLVAIGARVAVRRHQLGWTQSVLARRSKVTQRQVSALEHGKANVTIRTLGRVARALGLVVDLSEKLVRVGYDDERVRAAVSVGTSTAAFTLAAEAMAVTGASLAAVPAVRLHAGWDRRMAV